MNCIKEKRSNFSYLRFIGCKCYIQINDRVNLGKVDSKINEGIFLVILQQVEQIWYTIRT